MYRFKAFMKRFVSGGSRQDLIVFEKMPL